MKHKRYVLQSVIFAIILCVAAQAFARSEVSGKVVKVSDGDTITVLAPGFQQIKVRLYGIDCPEKKQAFGQRARQYTTQRIAGEQVRIEIMDHDRYGRTVGVVYAENGQKVNGSCYPPSWPWFIPSSVRPASAMSGNALNRTRKEPVLGYGLKETQRHRGNGGRCGEDKYA